MYEQRLCLHAWVVNVETYDVDAEVRPGYRCFQPIPAKAREGKAQQLYHDDPARVALHGKSGESANFQVSNGSTSACRIDVQRSSLCGPAAMMTTVSVGSFRFFFKGGFVKCREQLYAVCADIAIIKQCITNENISIYDVGHAE